MKELQPIKYNQNMQSQKNFSVDNDDDDDTLAQLFWKKQKQ